MRLLHPTERVLLRPFLPQRPGPLVGQHVLNTGYGACWVDRWPDPRAILCQAADNYALHGEPDALAAKDLELRFQGMLEAGDRFQPLLGEMHDSIEQWPRQIFELRRPPPSFSVTAQLRPIEPSDAYQLFGLALDVAWVADTWGGAAGLAASGLAWGAFVHGELASVATPFFVGDQYEDIAVVTTAEFRGQGLNPACASALARDIQQRGHIPSWTTSPDNQPSLRVAEKLGFDWVRDDRLLAIGVEIPPSATPPKGQRTGF